MRLAGHYSGHFIANNIEFDEKFVFHYGYLSRSTVPL